MHGVRLAVALCTVSYPCTAATLGCADFHASGFQRSQCEQRIADLHGQRLTATRAAPEHLHGLAGHEANLGKTAQQGGVSALHVSVQSGDDGPAAVGQIQQMGDGHGFRSEAQV
jgi:hypothetical protein